MENSEQKIINKMAFGSKNEEFSATRKDKISACQTLFE